MENNLHFLEVAWAAQRSGLYYTAVNSHLRRNEVQYILDDCGASALVTSSGHGCRQSSRSTFPGSVCVLRRRGARGIRLLRGVDRVVSGRPIEDECEGREMLYSSGTTGRPKGVQKQLPLTPLGDLSAAPVLIASRMALSGAGPGSGLPVAGTALPLRPARLLHVDASASGATVVVMEHFDPARCLELI